MDTIEVRLHQRPPIRAAMGLCESQARFICAVAGRRGAKTWHGAEKFIDLVMRDLARELASGRPYKPGAYMRGTALWWKRRPRLHYWVVAATYDLLQEALTALHESIPAELIEHDGDKHIWLRGDVLIQAKTGVKPLNLVSRGLNGVWIEEASRLRADAWQGALRPTLSDKMGWCLITGTPLGRDWVYEQFVRKTLRTIDGRPNPDFDADYAFFTWHTADNPFISPKEIEAARRSLAPEYFAREYEASFEAFVGQIYKRFDSRVDGPRQHIVTKLPPGTRFKTVIGGLDWGTSAPGAAIVVGIDIRDHVWILDEVYSSDELVEEFWAPECQRLQRRYRISHWVADPAEPDNLRRLRKAGLEVVKHSNGPGSGEFDEHARSVMSGIRTVSGLYHQDRLHILSRCQNVIEETKSYRWASLRGGSTIVLRDFPEPHQKDHAITAMRYAITSEIRIDDGMRAAA